MDVDDGGVVDQKAEIQLDMNRVKSSPETMTCSDLFSGLKKYGMSCVAGSGPPLPMKAYRHCRQIRIYKSGEKFLYMTKGIFLNLLIFGVNILQIC